MADENGYNYKLTTVFDDGDSVVEYFKTDRGVEGAKKWWENAAKMDGTYTLTGFDVEHL